MLLDVEHITQRYPRRATPPAVNTTLRAPGLEAVRRNHSGWFTMPP